MPLCQASEGKCCSACMQDCCWGSGVVWFQWSFLSSAFVRSHVTAFSSANLIVSSVHLFTSLCFLGLLTRRLVYIVWHLRNTIFQSANLLYARSYRKEPGCLPAVKLFKQFRLHKVKMILVKPYHWQLKSEAWYMLMVEVITKTSLCTDRIIYCTTVDCNSIF